jgi:hypothetical protein
VIVESYDLEGYSVLFCNSCHTNAQHFKTPTYPVTMSEEIAELKKVVEGLQKEVTRLSGQ